MLDEGHLRESLLAHVVPPPLAGLDPSLPLPPHAAEPPAALVRMGFPQRVSLAARAANTDGSGDSDERKQRSDHSLCFCHGVHSLIAPQQTPTPTLSSTLDAACGEERELYVCPQCLSKYCALPAECGVCGLVLVAAPLLSRAFRHLFPLAPFTELQSDAQTTSNAPESDLATTITSGVNSSIRTDSNIPTNEVSRLTGDSEREREAYRCCYGCLEPFAGQQLRTRCDNCKQCFCAECDVALHQSVQSCPGCCAAGINLALT